jgi:hypothetical protein
MAKLLQALKRNPDAIALAALSIVLGVGRQAIVARPMAAFSDKALGIHWVCVKPATDALDCLRARLCHLAFDASATFRLPDLHR